MVYVEVASALILALPVYRYLDAACALVVKLCMRFARAFASLVISAALVAFARGIMNQI